MKGKFFKKEGIQQRNILHRHQGQIPLRNTARPSWFPTVCLPCTRVEACSCRGSIPSVIVHCGKDFFVRLLLLIAYHLPHKLWGRSHRVRDAGSCRATWGLDRPPRLKGERVFSFTASDSLPGNRDSDNRWAAPQRRFEAHSTDKGFTKSSDKINKKRSEKFFQAYSMSEGSFLVLCLDNLFKSTTLWSSCHFHLVFRWGS